MVHLERLLTITVNSDESAAIAPLVPVGTSMDDIRFSLEKAEISRGIDWNSVEEQLQRINETKTNGVDVLLASIKTGPYAYDLCGTRYPDEAAFAPAKKTLEQTHRVLADGENPPSLLDVYYVKAGEPFLSCDFGDAGYTVRGKSRGTVPVAPFKNSSGIRCARSKKGYGYTASESGYLTLDEKNCLRLIDPVEVSEDRYKLYFTVLPVGHGMEALKEKYTRLMASVENNGATDTLPQIEEHRRLKKVSRLLVREGKRPVKGRDAKITVYMAGSQDLVPDDNGTINYKNTSIYKEVKEGAIIAEKLLMIPSSPGCDVLGTIVPVEPTKDEQFFFGENVVEERAGDVIRYRAKETGIICLEENRVNVRTELYYDGDVSFKSGNIHFSRDIVITGWIRAGFSVDCGGNLTVLQGIEDNCTIKCRGDLKVTRGIYGKGTSVLVRGEAVVGFLHECTLRINGNLTVEQYAHHAQVRCLSSIRILGIRSNATGKASAIGGMIAAHRAVEAHSAGSHAALTSFCVGTDPELYEQMKKLENVKNAQEKQVMMFQSYIGVDLTDPKLLTTLKNQPLEKRKTVQAKFIKLREMIANKHQINTHLEKIRPLAVAPDSIKPTIRITGPAYPEIMFLVRGYRKRLTENNFNLVVSLSADNHEAVISHPA